MERSAKRSCESNQPTFIRDGCLRLPDTDHSCILQFYGEFMFMDDKGAQKAPSAIHRTGAIQVSLFHQHLSRPMSFEVQVCYTFTTGTDVATCSPDETQDQDLQDIAKEIAVEYVEVLSALFGGLDVPPGTERLQLAFAAACGGYSLTEWNKLGPAQKDAQRERLAKFYRPSETAHDMKPPTLVIYLGGKRRIKSSASYQLLRCDVEHNSDLEQWDNIWTEARTTGELPCEWGWHVRDSRAYNGARFIFLSGAFVVWPLQWRNSAKLKSSYPQKLASLKTFLKVVLFRELVHAVRSILLGTIHITPEKVIDDPRYVKTSPQHGVIGEAGRLAEKLAFGRVVSMNMENLNITLYVCDDDEERTPYKIPPKDLEDLFHRNTTSPPLLMENIRSYGSPLNHIPPAERFKSNFHDETIINITSPSSSSFIIPSPSRGLIRVTGPEAAVMVALDRARGSYAANEKKDNTGHST
ncbi:hypothetical protein D9757_002480 [Collybiopsis confluens]|uniref:Uncharacterized protein n=1 Tax=Collybiopsis confluens TaxID=2823264 RepID=A0A8H5HYE9_9AGAR|nr:hypothetical protein D9757_002480 [Collybiopsis confluens]